VNLENNLDLLDYKFDLVNKMGWLENIKGLLVNRMASLDYRMEKWGCMKEMLGNKRG
jgi:hypothetical protein